MKLLVDTDDRYAHGIIAETGTFRVVAFWKREFDTARAKYDPWTLKHIVIERQDEDAMKAKVWLRTTTFEYGSYANVPDDAAASWLRSYLSHLAFLALKEAA